MKTNQPILRNASLIGMLLIATATFAQGWKGANEDGTISKDETTYESEEADGWKGNSEDSRLTKDESNGSNLREAGPGTGTDQQLALSKKEAKVYPTVVKDQLNVSFSWPESGEVEVELYDLIGKRVWKKTIWNDGGAFHHTIAGDIAGCGTYIVRVTQGSLTFTRKIYSTC